MRYRPLVRFVNPGEAVAAGIVGRVDEQLHGNIEYLRELLNAVQAGQALRFRDVPFSPSVRVGSPVYWDSTQERFDLARLDTEVGSDGLLTLAESGRPWGVAASVHPIGVGDVVLLGAVKIDLRDVVEGGVGPGVHYLSSVFPGKLTRVKPALAVPVLIHDGRDTAFVHPQWRDVLGDHEHQTVELVCRPAGSTIPPVEPDPHVVDSPNPDLPGWLPANHAVFAGKAPVGAKFGYNMNAHPRLKALWPPVPVQAVDLIWSRPDVVEGGVSVPRSLYVADSNGLWWMSDCWGDAPWPVDFDSNYADNWDCVEPPEGCPRTPCMRMTAHFLRLRIGAGVGLVESLTAVGAGLRVFCETDPNRVQKTGRLAIQLNLGLDDDEDGREGHVVFKAFQNNRFLKGPVVESIEAGGDAVLLTSTHPRGGLHQGKVTIHVDADATLRSLEVQLVKLENTSQEYPFGVPAVGFLPGRDASMVGKINIPPVGLPSQAGIVLRFLIGGSLAGTTPNLTLAYRRLPRPSVSEEIPINQPLFVVSTATGWSPERAIASPAYYEVESPPLPVDPGDVFLFSLTRDDADLYTGIVYLIGSLGRIVSIG
jgi:hypothetical protein